MQIYFLRHGDALLDGERPLSPKGVKQVERVAKSLRELGVEIDALFTSPLIRASETADIVGAEFGITPEETGRLDSGAELQGVRVLLERLQPDSSVMLVGHEPDFSTMISELIGGGYVEMKKAGVALVECDRPAMCKGVLKWLAPPKRLKA